MNKKTKVILITLGLVVLMAVPAFASQGALGNRKFSWGSGRQSNIEIIAKKAGVSVDEILKKKESVSNCKELLDEYGLTLEEIKEARLEQQFKIVDERVAAGDITKEEGETIKEEIKSHRFLQDCNGPHHGKREGMKLNMSLKRGEGACEDRQGAGGHRKGNGGQGVHKRAQACRE